MKLSQSVLLVGYSALYAAAAPIDTTQQHVDFELPAPRVNLVSEPIARPPFIEEPAIASPRSKMKSVSFDGDEVARPVRQISQGSELQSPQTAGSVSTGVNADNVQKVSPTRLRAPVFNPAIAAGAVANDAELSATEVEGEQNSTQELGDNSPAGPSAPTEEQQPTAPQQPPGKKEGRVKKFFKKIKSGVGKVLHSDMFNMIASSVAAGVASNMALALVAVKRSLRIEA